MSLDTRAYWNERANLGAMAGTQDLNLVRLERKVIQSFVRPGMRVLDVGCGTGETLASLPDGVVTVGLDSSPAMLDRAGERPILTLIRAGVLDGWDAGTFDLIYTQRCLINLSAEEQIAAVRKLCGMLAPGGSFLAVEHSALGLCALNLLRQSVGLTAIEPPWHNTYLSEVAMRRIEMPGITLAEDAVDFSSTYYVLSRVVNAWQAQREGQTPSYDAPINELAMQLPPRLGRYGQARYWRWERA